MFHTSFLLLVGCWIGLAGGLLVKGLTRVSSFSAQDMVEPHPLADEVLQIS